MATITRSQLHEGEWLVIKPTITALMPPGTPSKVVAFKSSGGYQYVGLEVSGFTNGHDLDGRLTQNKTAGFWFNMSQLNEVFELMPEGMVPITEKVDFDSVILAEKKKEQIVHALKQIDNHELIFVKWGFSKTFEKGKGVSMLFYGPPGTGKTLMAQAISHKLDYALKIISNADIQSSVPGEAERNIRKHFKDNKGKNSVLLFDECDSLIYTRASTGPILGAQINELLSQLERFEGITIFTTNRLGTLDEAVNRRLSIKVQFAMPDLKERVKIWQRMFPAEAPLSRTIDWKKLARHRIAGGHIKNAVLRAAREAASVELADDKKTITMKHLLKGLQQEVDATKEFQRAKDEWEGRYQPHDGMVHEGGKLTKSESLDSYRQVVRGMKTKSAE